MTGENGQIVDSGMACGGQQAASVPDIACQLPATPAMG